MKRATWIALAITAGAATACSAQQPPQLTPAQACEQRLAAVYQQMKKDAGATPSSFATLVSVAGPSALPAPCQQLPAATISKLVAQATG